MCGHGLSRCRWAAVGGVGRYVVSQRRAGRWLGALACPGGPPCHGLHFGLGELELLSTLKQ